MVEFGGDVYGQVQFMYCFVCVWCIGYCMDEVVIQVDEYFGIVCQYCFDGFDYMVVMFVWWVEIEYLLYVVEIGWFGFFVDVDGVVILYIGMFMDWFDVGVGFVEVVMQ